MRQHGNTDWQPYCSADKTISFATPQGQPGYQVGVFASSCDIQGVYAGFTSFSFTQTGLNYELPQGTN